MNTRGASRAVAKSARRKKGQLAAIGMMGCHGQLSRLDPASEQWVLTHRQVRQRDRTVILSREDGMRSSDSD